MVLAPVTALILAFVQTDTVEEVLRSAVSVIVGAGAHLIVMRAVRDRGNSVQPKLWTMWGGSPTIDRMRWAGNRPKDIDRLHRRIQHMTGVMLPRADDEAAAPADADDTYNDAALRLREMTRDHSRYPRVYAELVQYGTARNLLGAKTLGVTAAVAVLAIAGILAVLAHRNMIDVNWWSLPLTIGTAAIVLVIWVVRITPEYVRPAAARYADALVSVANEPGAHP